MSMLAWVSVAAFLAAYALIATEKVHRVAAALGGAGIMLLIHATNAKPRSSPSTPASTGTSSSCCSA
ncbi:hypothetical protein ACIBIZ_51605 [Nonomuraea spiralis]|uniref:hypothetical protein n=1 Tax=Nonomuraea spiralis TaxID=46182 RepID=UPI003799AB2E